MKRILCMFCCTIALSFVGTFGLQADELDEFENDLSISSNDGFQTSSVLEIDEDDPTESENEIVLNILDDINDETISYRMKRRRKRNNNNDPVVDFSIEILPNNKVTVTVLSTDPDYLSESLSGKIKIRWGDTKNSVSKSDLTLTDQPGRQQFTFTYETSGEKTIQVGIRDDAGSGWVWTGKNVYISSIIFGHQISQQGPSVILTDLSKDPNWEEEREKAASDSQNGILAVTWGDGDEATEDVITFTEVNLSSVANKQKIGHNYLPGLAEGTEIEIEYKIYYCNGPSANPCDTGYSSGPILYVYNADQNMLPIIDVDVEVSSNPDGSGTLIFKDKSYDPDDNGIAGRLYINIANQHVEYNDVLLDKENAIEDSTIEDVGQFTIEFESGWTYFNVETNEREIWYEVCVIDNVSIVAQEFGLCMGNGWKKKIVD